MSLKDTLSNFNFKFNKQFGQNFISDSNLLSAIVGDAEITSEDVVLEIGVGAATLTKKLAAAAKRVVAFEIDRNLEPIITDALKDCDNVTVVYADALNYADDEIKALLGGSFKLVANLPYYITTPIIMKFIEGDYPVQSITVMVQYEVAKRFTAAVGTADYGAVTVALNFVSEPIISRKVSRNMFYPVPNVDSAIVRIPILRNKYGIEYSRLRKLVKTAFAMRRKTLVNNLLSGYALTRTDAEAALNSCGFDVRIRGENLSAVDFIKLYEALQPYICDSVGTV